MTHLNESIFITTNTKKVNGRKLLASSIEFITDPDAEMYIPENKDRSYPNYLKKRMVCRTAKDSLLTAIENSLKVEKIDSDPKKAKFIIYTK